MVVRLRLARPPGHTRKTTHFNLVAVDIRKRRDAKPIEIVGVYDPVPHQVKRPQPLGAPPVLSREPEKLEKRIEWSVGRIRYWLSVGAQPSETVASLLRKGGIMESTPRKPAKKPSSPPIESGPVPSPNTPPPEP